MNIGVYDLGGSNIKYAVMTETAEILYQNARPTAVMGGLEAYTTQLTSIFEEMKARADLAGIAISTNGRLTEDGSTYRAYIADFLMGFNLKEAMERATGLPVVIISDGYAAALGEWWKGAGQGTQNMAAIVLGTAMGGGMIINGKLYEGSRKNGALVFGLLTRIDPEQNVYKASGLDTSFMMMLYQVSMMKQLPMEEVTGVKFFEWVEEGDPLCCGLLEKYCYAVATVIFDCGVLMDPDCIVVTGGITAQPTLMAGIQKALDAISGQAFEIPGVSFGQDDRDRTFEIRQGALPKDANLYGALYWYLEQAGK